MCDYQECLFFISFHPAHVTRRNVRALGSSLIFSAKLSSWKVLACPLCSSTKLPVTFGMIGNIFRKLNWREKDCATFPWVGSKIVFSRRVLRNWREEVLRSMRICSPVHVSLCVGIWTSSRRFREAYSRARKHCGLLCLYHLLWKDLRGRRASRVLGTLFASKSLLSLRGAFS